MTGLTLLLRAEWAFLFLAGIYRYLEMHGNPYWLLPALLAPAGRSAARNPDGLWQEWWVQ